MSGPLSPHTCDESPIGLLKRFMGLEETQCPECRRRCESVQLKSRRSTEKGEYR